MAVCLAVISKENYPLYIKCGSPENELNFHYTGKLVERMVFLVVQIRYVMWWEVGTTQCAVG